MQKKDVLNPFVPTFVPIMSLKKQYTTPKIHIPKVEKNGKLVPTVAKGKYWYVYYYFRSPYTGKLERFKEKLGVNTLKTVTERKKYIKNLQKAILLNLQKGYNPFEEFKPSLTNQDEFNVKEAIELALQEKNKVWSKASVKNKTSIINAFIRWLKKEHLYTIDIHQLKKRHIILYLNQLKVNATTRNSYRRVISAVFGQMADDEIIATNYVNAIPKLKEQPKKNKAFTKKEVEKIKKYLLKHDPYLYTFIKFVMYGFFRPVEVTRIKVENINLNRNTISVQSKTEAESVVFITSQLKETILAMDLNNYKGSDFIFTKNFCPGPWEVSTEKSKTRFFSFRFQKLKTALGFNKDYGIYSFRHSASIDLFTSFKKQGLTDLEARHKMLPITRHKSIDSLNKYLRGIGASLPKDYSDDYTLDF